MARGKRMESTLLSDRDKRCLSRAWSRGEEMLAKQYTLSPQDSACALSASFLLFRFYLCSFFIFLSGLPCL